MRRGPARKAYASGSGPQIAIWKLLGRVDRNDLPRTHALKFDDPINRGKQRVVTAAAHVAAGVEHCAALPEENTHRGHGLTRNA